MPEYRFITVGRVVKVIKEWNPTNCKTEAQFRSSLYKKMVASFKKPPIKEFGVGRLRADLAWDKDIAIELKLNMNKTGKYHRLIGQLVDYRKEFFNTIIVLVGDTDPGLYRNLKKEARDMTVIMKQQD